MDLQTANGRESLFWSITHWGKDFPEMIKLVTINCQCKTLVNDRDCQCKSVVIEQRIEEVTIGESWKGVTRCLLNRLIENHPGEGFLPDTTPIINLIILAGKHFQMKGKNFTENLFDTFIKQIGMYRRDFFMLLHLHYYR